MTTAEVRDLLRGAGDQDRWYPWYLAALLIGLVLAPGYWSLVMTLALFVGPSGPLVACLLSAGVAVLMALAAALTPRYLGPVWTSAEEIHYLVGPFGIRPVLGLRTALLQLLTGLLGLALCLLPVLAWWQGSGHPAGGAPVFLTAAGIGMAGGLGAAVLSRAKQSVRRRPTGAGALDVPRLEELTAGRDTALAGVLIGDARSVSGAVPRRRPRGAAPAFPLGLTARSWAIDVRYARQDPWWIALCLFLVLAASAVLSLWGIGPGSLAAVLLTAQLATTRVSGALGDVADTVGYDVVVPQPTMARLVAHLVFPAVAVVPMALLPVMVLAPGSAGAVLGMVLGALLLRCATLGVAGLPAQYLTPVATPMGDATAMFMVLWLLRPVIPVAWVLWAGLSFPLVRVTGVLCVVLAVLALLRLRGLSRQG